MAANAASRLSSPQQLILALNGKPTYLGTIVATSSSATLTVPAGSVLLIQPDADTYVSVSAVAVAATSVKVRADDTLVVTIGSNDTAVSAIGAANVKVFTLV